MYKQQNALNQKSSAYCTLLTLEMTTTVRNLSLFCLIMGTRSKLFNRSF